jgi:hypothetical protein
MTENSKRDDLLCHRSRRGSRRIGATTNRDCVECLNDFTHRLPAEDNPVPAANDSFDLE